MINIPSGTVTFLFTDIEGSTRLAQKFLDSYTSALEHHNEVLKEIINSYNGFVFDVTGDAFCSSFKDSADAVKAAIMIQKKLSEDASEARIKVRIGIDCGKAEWNGSTYLGYVTLARTNRIMSAAFGEQILISHDALNSANQKSNEASENIAIEDATGRISFRDLGERRLKDLNNPVRIFQIIAENLSDNFPPIKTLDARPNNLPFQLTSFIGREEEERLVKELLKKTRLLTFAGPGGAGKTRFALHIAAAVIDDFPNGVWFSELAELSDGLMLPQTIMKVFSLKEEPNKSPFETLMNHLKEKECLIILDNCEQIIEKSSEITEKLLINCPKVKIIATSRESLRCAGEITHMVLPLNSPNPDEDLSPEKISQYESARLFIERALAVRSDFRVTESNVQALAEICYHLDGIPLAIELAAALIKMLTPKQISERLSNRFNLLTQGKRTALPRQKTLRALIDWSYDLLTEEEQILWRRLSVFSGGWTDEAAAEVCSNKIRKQDIFYMSTHLFEKSIIIFDNNKQRYGMLESILDYGKEKLANSQERENILSRHLQYFVEFAETAEPNLYGKEGKSWLEKVEEDHSNLRSAIEYSIESNEIDKGARIAGALKIFWDVRGYYSTGVKLINNLFENKDKISRISLAKLYFNYASLIFYLGEMENARRYYDRGYELQKELADQEGMANSLSGLANVEMYYGNYEKARKFYSDCMSIGKSIGMKRMVGMTLNNLGNIEYVFGNYEEAQRLYEESLQWRRDSNDKQGIATALCNLGNMAIDLGKFDLTEKYLTECIELCGEIGEKRLRANALNGLGSLKYMEGNYEEAWDTLNESINLNREIADKHGLIRSLNNIGDLECDEKDYDNASKHFDESLLLAKEMGDKSGIADAISRLGTIAYNQNNFEKAHMQFRQSLLLRRELGEKANIVISLIDLALLFVARNNFRCSTQLIGAVEGTSNSIGRRLRMSEQTSKEEIVRRLKENLTEEQFSKYYKEGMNMNLEEAVELALSS